MSYGFYPVYCCQQKQKDHTGAILASGALGAGVGAYYGNKVVPDTFESIGTDYVSSASKEYSQLGDIIDLPTARTALENKQITEEEFKKIEQCHEKLSSVAKANQEIIEGTAQKPLNVINESRVKVAEVQKTLQELPKEIEEKLVNSNILNKSKIDGILEEAHRISVKIGERAVTKLKPIGAKGAIGAAIGLVVGVILNSFSKN